MPILVACDCGKRFAAREHLFGQDVPCPECGNLFTVSTAGKNSVGGIFVFCDCGLAFHAPETMRGQQARCRGCGEVLLVSGPDPLGIQETDSSPTAAMVVAPLLPPPPPAEDEIPWPTLKRIGIIGGALLAAVIVGTTILQLIAPLLRGP